MGKKVFTQTVQSPTDMELELELELDRGSICKNLIWLLGAQKVEWNCTNGGSRTHWLCPMPIHHPAPRTVQGSCLSRTRRGGEGGKGSSLLGLAPTCPGADLPARSLAQLPVLPRLASASRSMSSDGTCCEFPPCWEDVFGQLLPRRVCRRPAEGGELPHRFEESEAPTLGDGAQVQCSRSRDLEGAQNKTESSLILTLLTACRRGPASWSSGTRWRRQGRVCSTRIVLRRMRLEACGQYMTCDLVPRWSASSRLQTSGSSSGTSLSCRPSQHPRPPQLTQDPPLLLIWGNANLFWGLDWSLKHSDKRVWYHVMSHGYQMASQTFSNANHTIQALTLLSRLPAIIIIKTYHFVWFPSLRLFK